MRVLSVLFLLSALLMGCQKGGGVIVGNGAKDGSQNYYSQKYHYGLTYRRALNFSKVSDEQIVITNRDLVAAETHANAKGLVIPVANAAGLDEMSSVSVSVLKKGEDYKRITTVKELKAYVKKHHRAIFKDVKFPGAAGVYTEKRSGREFKAHYYLLTTNLSVIHVEIDAKAFAHGMDWVAPIVRTFTYDGRAPRIYGLSITPSILRPGKPAQIRFKALDDFSGLAKFISPCSRFVPNFKFDGEDSPSVTVCGYVRLVDPKNKIYAMDIKVGKFVPSGQYYLESFKLADKAGNWLEINSKKKDGKLEAHYKGAYPKIPVLKVQVENKGVVDLKRPTISAVRLEPAEWTVGQKAKIVFEATDDKSGIAKFVSSCSSVVPNFQTGADGYGPDITGCGYIKREGKDTYSLEVKVGKFVPSGEYFLRNFFVVDNAGNEASLREEDGTKDTYNGGIPIPRVRVKNEGAVDVKAPTVTELRTRPAREFKAGTKTQLLFKMTDEVSGVSTSMNTCGQFVPNFRYKADTQPSISVCGTLVHVADDLYSIELKVGDYLPAGEYFLQSFYVNDVADNQYSYNAHLKDDGTLDQDHYPMRDGFRLPVMKIYVVK